MIYKYIITRAKIFWYLYNNEVLFRTGKPFVAFHSGSLAISVKRSRSQGHVYRQPNTPMNYTTTAVTFPPPPQQTYPISPQGNQAYPQPYPQYPSQPAYPQSGAVQQSANYPPQNKAEPTGLYKKMDQNWLLRKQVIWPCLLWCLQ